MTTVVSHGGRIGQHAMANLRDPATAVQLAKRLLQSGAWRTVPKQGDDTDRATYLLRAKVPAALAVLPRVAVAAMTKQPPSPGCHWCWVQVLAALSFGEDPYPDRTDATLAFLGTPCRRCQARHQGDDAAQAARADVAERERQTDAAVAAAGGPLAWYRATLTTARCSRCQQVHRSRLPATPSAPTGMLWPAGSSPPAAVAAALRSRPAADRFAWVHGDATVVAGRRGDDPPYYRHHGRRGGPGGY
jgi:hypothetical protein